MMISENLAPHLCAASTARRVASLKASLMPRLSISVGLTQPSPTAGASDLIICDNLSRFFAESFLESRRSAIHDGFGSGRTTAPTTSGPARGPRPTSSMPRIAIPD